MIIAPIPAGRNFGSLPLVNPRASGLAPAGCYLYIMDGHFGAEHSFGPEVVARYCGR